MQKEGQMREGQVRIPSGCAISGVINRDGRRVDGGAIAKSIAVMHDRSNGLGGGFAGYGIYPEYKDFYAFHIFYTNPTKKSDCEKFLEEHFEIINLSKIPTRKHPKITNEPLIWRYFVMPLPTKLSDSQLDGDEYTLRCVFKINTSFDGVYVFSSGKNMGVFKAVGYPEDVAEFYRLDGYSGYSWVAHGRYPTNTPGWWGGAHPFAVLDFSVVHNGEISSYDANRRFIEMFGYKCTLQTDTEVITYIWDYLVRRKKLTLNETAEVIAAPFWEKIKTMNESDRERLTYLRTVYSSLLITGPFSIIVGFEGGLLALNDRLKLRSMVVGEKNDTVYIASEESAIREIEPSLDRVWAPSGGEAVLVKLYEK
ncbi:MAG: hypothetical protein LBP62_03430 [Clostridiales bacterium]|jgi:glutamate synthase domain-containing protein 1|nr:hypothetical protein [Clostridiales bacterium]